MSVLDANIQKNWTGLKAIFPPTRNNKMCKLFQIYYTCNHTKDVELALCPSANTEHFEALVARVQHLSKEIDQMKQKQKQTQTQTQTPLASKSASAPPPKLSSRLLLSPNPANVVRNSNPTRANWVNTFVQGETRLQVSRAEGDGRPLFPVSRAENKPRACQDGVEVVPSLPPFPCRECRRQKERWERGTWKWVDGYEHGKLMHGFEPVEPETADEDGDEDEDGGVSLAFSDSGVGRMQREATGLDAGSLSDAIAEAIAASWDEMNEKEEVKVDYVVGEDGLAVVIGKRSEREEDDPDVADAIINNRDERKEREEYESDSNIDDDNEDGGISIADGWDKRKDREEDGFGSDIAVGIINDWDERNEGGVFE